VNEDSFGREIWRKYLRILSLRRSRGHELPKREMTSPEPAAALSRNPEKYERILEAALAVFAEKGFFVSRISDIADRANVADGTVYLYFKNKDEILATAISTAFDTFMNNARTELGKIADPVERLRKLARLHLEALEGNRNAAIVFQMELRQSTRLSEFSHQHLIEYFNLVRVAIQQGQRSGVFRKSMPDKIAANCFFGALDEMVTSWVLSEHPFPLADAADSVVDILLNGMQSSDNRRRGERRAGEE
jgi:TetR/AcrR family fatty acid metabolism transcriptional regulator